MKTHPYTHSARGLLGLLSVLSLFTTGCGRQAFEVPTQQSQAAAPGTFLIAPKVDLLLVTDDTGSITSVLPQIAQQFPGFLNTLQSSGWDYHFASIPLTKFKPIDQVMPSQYDPNWQNTPYGNLWMPPYPGATSNQPGAIPASFFRGPWNFNGYTTSDNNLAGYEPGLQNLIQTLQHGNTSASKFLRSDATLAVVVIGNGDDNSGIKFCDVYGNGQYYSCASAIASYWYCPLSGNPNYYTTCSSGSSGALAGSTLQQQSSGNSVSTYESQLIALKGGNRALTKFYAAVNTSNNGGNCLGSNSYYGARYIELAQRLGGAAINVCSGGISGALGALSSQLQFVRQGFVTRYIFTKDQPDVNSIRVFKVSGGSRTEITRAVGNGSGWIYEGYKGVYAIDYPAPMNWSTGFAIRLNGNAALVGNETAVIEYRQAGVNPSF